MRGRFSIWLLPAFVLVLLWMGGFLHYTKEISGPKFKSTSNAEGIVILTGTPARLKVGFELLKSGAAKRVLISGVNSQVSREQLRIAMGESDEIMSCCVDLGRIARDTVGNAYEASLWASEHNFNELLIVTSAYHMPRSLVELKRQMPNKSLYAFAPATDALKLEKWWKNPALIFVLSAEFNKYIVSLFRARLENMAMNGVSK